MRAVAWKIKPSRQFVSGDEKKVEEFYKEALKLGEEGIMIKRLMRRIALADVLDTWLS